MNIKFCKKLSIFNQMFDILKKETGNNNKDIYNRYLKALKDYEKQTKIKTKKEGY